MTADDQLRFMALRIAIEDVLDTLIEQRLNGDDDGDPPGAWRSDMIDDLILARDKPKEYLVKADALPGSELAKLQEQWRKEPTK